MKVTNLPIRGQKIEPAKAVSVRVKFQDDTGLDAATAAPTAWLNEGRGYVDLNPGEDKEAIIAVRRDEDWYTVTNVRNSSGYPPNTSVAELGEISRFDRARQLMGYSGAVSSEHSSGKRMQRGQITKTGNAHLRRIAMEAAWAYRYRPTIEVAFSTVDQSDIRGSKPHNRDPSGAASH